MCKQSKSKTKLKKKTRENRMSQYLFVGGKVSIGVCLKSLETLAVHDLEYIFLLFFWSHSDLPEWGHEELICRHLPA